MKRFDDSDKMLIKSTRPVLKETKTNNMITHKEITKDWTNPQGIQTPDYLIDGERFDLKTPTGSGKNLLYNVVVKKRKQSSNFIFDVTNCPLVGDEIERQIEIIYHSRHTWFVDKIVVMKNDKILKAYERQ